MSDAGTNARTGAMGPPDLIAKRKNTGCMVILPGDTFEWTDKL